MLNFTLLLNIAQVLIAFYLCNKVERGLGLRLNALNRIINIYWLLSFIYAAQIYFIRNNFPEYAFLDTGLPFGLLYGPLLYFGRQAADGKHIYKWKVFLHLLPLLSGVIIHILFVTVLPFKQMVGKYYYIGIYSVFIASLVTYGSIVQFKNNRKEPLHLFSILSMWAIIEGVFYAVVIYTEVLPAEHITDSKVPNIIVQVINLICVFETIKFRLDIIITNFRKQDDAKQEVGEENLSYQKSAIHQEQLIAYEKVFHSEMYEKKFYLRPKLSLDELAGELNIPPHHLTQLLNIHLGSNFNNYINELRIAYACLLLEDQENESSLELIAIHSGFNSKASFNRHFKQLKNCTPSEYRLLKSRQQV